MKPKAFFLMLTLLVVTTAASFAQTNITLVFPRGYSMFGNPLNSTNNRVSNIFQNPPEYLTIIPRNASGTGYYTTQYDPDFGPAWTDPSFLLRPGEGVFIYNPLAQNYTNTFYGEALLCSTNYIPSGYSIRSQAFPTNSLLDFPVSYGDTFFFYKNNGTYHYESTTYDPDIAGWSNGEPQPKVGEAFWIYHPPSLSATNWIICLTNSP